METIPSETQLERMEAKNANHVGIPIFSGLQKVPKNINTSKNGFFIELVCLFFSNTWKIKNNRAKSNQENPSLLAIKKARSVRR
jgi:hypothetical protein